MSFQIFSINALEPLEIVFFIQRDEQRRQTLVKKLAVNNILVNTYQLNLKQKLTKSLI